MNLLYDRVAGMFSLETDEGVEFLGPFTQSMLKLKEIGFTASQAREAVLEAFMSGGAPIPMEQIPRIASKYIVKAEDVVPSEEDDRARPTRQDGKGRGKGMPGGLRRNKNKEKCPEGGPGYGRGKGRGRGRNRVSAATILNG